MGKSGTNAMGENHAELETDRHATAGRAPDVRLPPAEKHQ